MNITWGRAVAAEKVRRGLCDVAIELSRVYPSILELSVVELLVSHSSAASSSFPETRLPPRNTCSNSLIMQ